MISVAGPSRAAALSFQDRDALEAAGSDLVDVAIRVSPVSAPQLKAAIAAGPQWTEFPELATVVARVHADALLMSADGPTIERIEIIDESITPQVLHILGAVRRLRAAHGTIFPIGALNVSLGVPKALLGKNRSAENTIREGLSKIVDLGFPVVMSIGNDGPGEDTANPWAMTPGVIVVTATDASGQNLWPSASRLRRDDFANRILFAAHGYLSIGARAAGSPKTQAMLDAESKVNLTALVGAGNEELYRVDSGTSYAAGEVTHAICLLHQATAAIGFTLSFVDPLQGALLPYVSAYFDSGIDYSHPMFKNRLADRSPKFGGLTYEVTREQRARLESLVFKGVVLNGSYTRERVVEMLRRSAHRIPGTSPFEVGSGFVSRDTVGEMLSALTLADLVQIFADRSDPRFEEWVHSAKEDAAPVFPPDDISKFKAYCDSYSLLYMLKVL